MSLHSPLGPSKAHIWMNCPGSVAICKPLVSVTTPAAEQGTILHDYASTNLLTGQWPKGISDADIEVLQVYIDFVHGLEARAGKDYRRWVETRVGAPRLHKDLWGTLDDGTYLENVGELWVVDLKTGSGVQVDPENNPQLLLYLLMLIETFGLRPVRMFAAISQPRIEREGGPNPFVEVTHKQLEDFSRTVAHAARATEEPQAPRIPGEWCRFCDASAVCPERQAEADKTAMIEFKGLAVPVFDSEGKPVMNLGYDPAELVRAWKMIPRLKAWIESVQAFIYSEALHGREPAGTKLVNKRLSNREWKDEKAVGSAFALMDVSNVYTTPKVKSPAALEKEYPELEELIAALTERHPTGYTLVEESDPRPGIASNPEADFSDLTKLSNLTDTAEKD